MGLDSRRDKATSTGAAADKARGAVADVERRIRTNADLTRQQKQSLRTARAEVTRLKRALKNAAEERGHLAKARTKAVRKAGRAEKKASAAERKYDRSVLAEIVRREKELDRAAAAVVPASPAETASRSPAGPAETAPESPALQTAARRTAAKAATATRRTAAKDTADPAPEQPPAATRVSTRTAARRTG